LINRNVDVAAQKTHQQQQKYVTPVDTDGLVSVSENAHFNHDDQKNKQKKEYQQKRQRQREIVQHNFPPVRI
jgi:hypothetical protein